MDNVTVIRAIAAVLFFVVLFVLVQRKKNRMGGARSYVSGNGIAPTTRHRG